MCIRDSIHRAACIYLVEVNTDISTNKVTVAFTVNSLWILTIKGWNMKYIFCFILIVSMICVTISRAEDGEADGNERK